MIRKADIGVIVFFVLLSIALLIFFAVGRKKGAEAVVTLNGVVQKILPLHANVEYTVSSENAYHVIVVHNGRVSMREANCPDQACMRHKPIQDTHEAIICLPNRVIVEIRDDTEADGTYQFDSIVY